MLYHSTIYCIHVHQSWEKRCDFDIKRFTLGLVQCFVIALWNPLLAAFCQKIKKSWEFSIYCNLFKNISSHEQRQTTCFLFVFQILSITFNDQYQVLLQFQILQKNKFQVISSQNCYFRSKLILSGQYRPNHVDRG